MNLTDALATVKNLSRTRDSKNLRLLTETKKVWEACQQRGKIVMFDSTMANDQPATRCGMLVGTDDLRLIRIELTKDDVLNLIDLLKGCV